MHGYSVENAERFDWSSVSGELNEERRSLLEREVVGSTVLDAGCAGGAYVGHLNRQGYRATGLERYAEFLRTRKEEGGFVQGDVTALPFRDDAFDTTYCFDVLEHLQDDEGALRELARVTRQRLILAVPKRDDFFRGHHLTYTHYQDPTHVRVYDEDSLRRTVQAAVPCAARVSVQGELRVDVRRLAHRLLRTSPATGSATARGMHWILLRLLARVPVSEMYSGLTAVVDLEEPGRP